MPLSLLSGEAMRTRPSVASKRGFTLVEALVSSSISAVVMIAAIGVLHITNRSKIRLASALASQQKSSAGTKLLKTELESAGNKFPSALWAVHVYQNPLDGSVIPNGGSLGTYDGTNVKSLVDTNDPRLKPFSDVIDIAMGDENSVPGYVQRMNFTQTQYAGVELTTPDPFPASFFTATTPLPEAIALFLNRNGQGCAARVRPRITGSSYMLDILGYVDSSFQEIPTYGKNFDFSSNPGSVGSAAFTAYTAYFTSDPGLKWQSYSYSPQIKPGCPNDSIVAGERMQVFALGKRKRIGVYLRPSATLAVGDDTLNGVGTPHTFLGIEETSDPLGVFPSTEGNMAAVRELIPNVVDVQFAQRIRLMAPEMTYVGNRRPASQAPVGLDVQGSFGGYMLNNHLINGEYYNDCRGGTCLINGPTTAVMFGSQTGGMSLATADYVTPSGRTIPNDDHKMNAMVIGVDVGLVVAGGRLVGDTQEYGFDFAKDVADVENSLSAGGVRMKNLYGDRTAAGCAGSSSAACTTSHYHLDAEKVTIGFRNFRVSAR